MFRVSQHPSSGVLKTVTAASGIGQMVQLLPSNVARSGLVCASRAIRPHCREVAVPVL